MTNEEIDCESTDDVVCPHCGAEFIDSHEFFMNGRSDATCECEECGKAFEASRDISITYSTRKKK